MLFLYFLPLLLKVVDASQSFDDVHKALFDDSKKVINAVKHEPVGTLWMDK